MKVSGCPVLTRLRVKHLAPRPYGGSPQRLTRARRLVPVLPVCTCHHPRRNLTLVIVAVLLLAACGKKAPVVQPPPEIRTVTVEVPTIVKATPPPELLAPFKFPLPMFISPFDPNATSALDAQGERDWRGVIEELLQRLAAWKKWAETKE